MASETQREKISEERTFFLSSQNALKFFETKSPKKFYKYQSRLKYKKLLRLCKRLLISSIDTYWSQYLADIGQVREEIHLYSLGGRVPFFEFQKIAEKLRSGAKEAVEKIKNLKNIISITDRTSESDNFVVCQEVDKDTVQPQNITDKFR